MTRWMKPLAIFVLTAMLSTGWVGCLGARIADALNSWIGSTTSELVAQKGPPDQTFENDGKTYLTYIDVIAGSNPATGQAYHVTNKTTFITKDGVIVGWRTR